MKNCSHLEGPPGGFRVGFWMSEKKSRKFNQVEFLDACRAHGLDPVPIDLTCPLEEQGPFTLILHKLTDVIAKANWGDMESKKIIHAFKEYLHNHPDVIMVDPLENILDLLDRTRTYNLISCSQMSKEHVLCTPAFVELTTTDLQENISKLKSAGISFPIICKPTVAHGSSLAHQMALIFHEEGLKDIIPPCVAQMFVNHDAILYKLYIIGDKWFRVDRPSLKNFYPGVKPTIFFDSHQVSKADSDSLLNKLDEEDQGKTVVQPEDGRLNEIVTIVRETLGMGLFGIDVVIDNQTGHYSIVDINAFPGYDGVPDFLLLLIQYMQTKIQNAKQVQLPRVHSSFREGGLSLALPPPQPLPPPSLTRACPATATDYTADKDKTTLANALSDKVVVTSSSDASVATKVIDSSPEDSGIDTGDSSDEKKYKKLIASNKVIRRQHSKCASITVAATASCSQ